MSFYMTCMRASDRLFLQQKKAIRDIRKKNKREDTKREQYDRERNGLPRYFGRNFRCMTQFCIVFLFSTEFFKQEKQKQDMRKYYSPYSSYTNLDLYDSLHSVKRHSLY